MRYQARKIQNFSQTCVLEIATSGMQRNSAILRSVKITYITVLLLLMLLLLLLLYCYCYCSSRLQLNFTLFLNESTANGI